MPEWAGIKIFSTVFLLTTLPSHESVENEAVVCSQTPCLLVLLLFVCDAAHLSMPLMNGYYALSSSSPMPFPLKR